MLEPVPGLFADFTHTVTEADTASHWGSGGLDVFSTPSLVGLMESAAVEDVDRIGLERQTYSILGIPLPHVVVPVRPGRDIARLIEVAALDQKLKSLGHNAAREFNERLIERMRTKQG